MNQIDIYNDKQDLIETLRDIDCFGVMVNESGLLCLSYMRKDSHRVLLKDLHFGEYFVVR